MTTMNAYDHYKEANDIAIALDREGFDSAATQIREAIEQGATGTEIFMRLRFCLTPLLVESRLSSVTKDRVHVLHAKLDEALRK
jgi:hypothetical protein